jgi:hypothetical protein
MSLRRHETLPAGCTGFCSIISNDDVIDLTQKKMEKLILIENDKNQQNQLIRFLSEYKMGNVQIAWKGWKPFFQIVKKTTEKG